MVTRLRLARAAELRIAASVLGRELSAAQVETLVAVLDGRRAARAHPPGVVGALVGRGLLDAREGELVPSRELSEVLS